MNSIDGFFSFSLELNLPEVSTKVRLKLPRHNQESLEHFYGKIVAYCHSYTPTLALKNEFEETVLQDAEGGVVAFVGRPNLRGLMSVVRTREIKSIRVYFYDQNSIERFLHDLRGQPTDWTESVSFLLIPPGVIQEIIATEQSSSRWNVTIVDEGELYLDINGLSVISSLELLNIPKLFQESIRE